MKKVILNYIAYVILSLIIPCYLISMKYQVFETIKNPRVQLLGGFTIITIVVFFFIRGQINDIIESIEDGKFKSIVKRTKSVSILLIMLLVLKVAKVHVANAEFIITWSLVSNLIASYFYVEYREELLKFKKQRGE